MSRALAVGYVLLGWFIDWHIAATALWHAVRGCPSVRFVKGHDGRVIEFCPGCTRIHSVKP